jgi:hypothetical protein
VAVVNVRVVVVLGNTFSLRHAFASWLAATTSSALPEQRRQNQSLQSYEWSMTQDGSLLQRVSACAIV